MKQTELLSKMTDEETGKVVKKIVEAFLYVQEVASVEELDVNGKIFLVELIKYVEERTLFTPPATHLLTSYLSRAWGKHDVSAEDMSNKQMGFFISLFDIRSPLGNTLGGTEKSNGDSRMTFWDFPITILPKDLG